jgi:hypothetical protein
MAMTLKDLESQLSGLQTYTPETEDALRTRAENIYNPQYQQDLQSLRDSLQQGLNQQSRTAISAGMQRSSYNQSALAALRGQGLRAEAQLGAQRDANIANLLNQLIEGEKDRKLNADANKDNLLLQLYQLANKGGSGKGSNEKTLPGVNPDRAFQIWLNSLTRPTSESFYFTTEPDTKLPTTTQSQGLTHHTNASRHYDKDLNKLLG